jgi:choline dehydrogenase-like flavoprotein
MTGSASSAERFDAIVVGAGVCGCVLARRLAEAGLRTVLLEEGPPGPLPPVLVRGHVGVGPESAPDWFRTSAEVSTTVHGPPIPYLQGRGMGGGSAVNGLVLSAGTETDYTCWTRWFVDGKRPRLGIERWLQRALSRLRPETSQPGLVAEAFDRVVGDRWRLVHGPNSSVLGGRGLLPVAVARRNRNRLTVADAYLEAPVVLRPRTAVRRLDHRSGRITGVITTSGDRLRADHVVLCTGPLQSPAVLMRSGLVGGTGAEASRSSIGWRGLDHPAIGLGFHWPSPAHTPSTIAEVRRLARGHVGSGPRAADVTVQVMGPFPSSTGSMGLVLAMTDPAGAPVEVAMSADGSSTIGRRWLDGPGLAGGAGLTPWLVREFVHLADALVAELHPGPDHDETGVYIDDIGTPAATLVDQPDDGIKAWMERRPAPLYHLAGTITESSDVVRLDPDRPGSIDGVAGLTVADSSTMPGLVGGGVQLAAMAWAEFVACDLVARLTGP